MMTTRPGRIGRAARTGTVAAAAAVAVLAAGCGSGGDSGSAEAAGTTTGTQETTAPQGPCHFAATPQAAQAAARDVHPPTETDPPTTGTVAWGLDTSAGDIGVTMDRAEAPCTVASMVSLTRQGFFDDTPCHRLTDSGIFVLQCGDPTGQGTGGPGYTVPDEFPEYSQDSTVSPDGFYPRGTVAMANSGGPDTGGSQFFLVYRDSPLPPKYTVFGTIDSAGLAVLDGIAAQGTAEGPNGMTAPAQPVTIESATVDAAAG